jgi:hypothetical protein
LLRRASPLPEVEKPGSLALCVAKANSIKSQAMAPNTMAAWARQRGACLGEA